MIRSNRILVRHKQATKLHVKRPTVEIVDFEAVTTYAVIPSVVGFSRPLSERETKFLADGERADDFRVFDSSSQLYAADDKLGVTGDIIFDHLGFDWRIVGAKTWGDGSRHNWYKIQKISLGGETK